MAGPKPRLVTLFHRCALQRYEEALVLRAAGRTTGAVYLAGYGVECILKALVLAATPPSRLGDAVAMFRGQRAHDYDWLRDLYREQGGPSMPKDVTRQFFLVGDWSTNLRYLLRTYPPREADRFLAAGEAILRWAEGRL